MGKSTAHDANDGNDDELQRFSKWGGAFSADGRCAMGGSLESTSTTKPVAVAVPLGTSATIRFVRETTRISLSSSEYPGLVNMCLPTVDLLLG